MPTMTAHADTDPEAFADTVVARAATPFDRLEVRAKTAAAVTAAGKGDDAPADAEVRAALRARALGWLKDELVAWAKLLEPGDTVSRLNAVRSLLHWKKDGDLAGVRDADVLARLPEAERKDWQAPLGGRRPPAGRRRESPLNVQVPCRLDPTLGVQRRDLDGLDCRFREGQWPILSRIVAIPPFVPC